MSAELDEDFLRQFTKDMKQLDRERAMELLFMCERFKVQVLPAADGLLPDSRPRMFVDAELYETMRSITVTEAQDYIQARLEERQDAHQP